MRVDALAGILGMVIASGAFGKGESPPGEVVIAEGSGVEVNGCFLELEFTCDGPEGRLAGLVEDCGEKPGNIGMGLLEGDCVAVGNALYCVDRVVVGLSVSVSKRYALETGPFPENGLRSGDVLRAVGR
jgi:hypothetical protein